MLLYQLRLAWLSLKRTPVLTLLLVGGIGLGIAVAMTFVTAYYLLSADPIPHKSSELFYVQLDSWSPVAPFDEDPTEPPDQVTYRDLMAVMESEIPTFKTGMYIASLTVEPGGERRPYRETVRLCTSDFFAMFDVPFRYGAGWDDTADAGPEPVAVIDAETNESLFGGENSVGRTIRLEDEDYRIVGVLDAWRPLPKFYDPHNDEFGKPEAIYLPFRHGPVHEWRTSGNTSGWKTYGSTFDDLLQSEAVWLQMWVQIDGARQKEEFLDYLDAYVLSQKELGRFERPLNNRLRDVGEWLTLKETVPEEARGMLVISLLFLLICAVNLIGILLGKFLARSPEIGVRRALGASRRWVFLQHLLECQLIGVLGAGLGVGLSALSLKAVDRLFAQDFGFRLDLTMLGAAILLSLLAALVAGVYPAWRICRVQPGIHLKMQ